MKRFVLFFLATLLLGTAILRAEDPDEAYVDVYSIVKQADALEASGKGKEALAKYRQAQAALSKFRQNHPEFQPKTVEYRANYLTQKIQQLSVAAALTNQQTTNASGQSQSSGNLQSQSSSGVSVKLISPGSEPRAPLRLHPKEGDKQTTTVTFNIKNEVSLGGNKMPDMPSPAIIITSESTIKSVSPDGDISFEIITKDIPALPQLKDLSANGLLTSRGIKKSIDAKIPSGLPPQLRPIAEQIKEGYSSVALALPDEPVGIGAKWEIKTPIKSGGMSMVQIETCELASLEGDKAVVRVSYTYTAPNQKIENPSMPGVKMDLTHFTGTGSGETILDLGKMGSTQSTMDGQIEMTMVTAGAQKQEINVKETLNVTTNSK